MKEALIEKIKQTENNRITYADYIGLALYDPNFGYYMKDTKKLGPQGDFYTSSGVHSVFGRAFARLFHDLIEKEKLPASILEFGGGDGRFAKAVMDEWAIISPQRNLSYTIIETSPFHRKEQQKLLTDHQYFQQFESLTTYQSSVSEVFEGIIFSNELLDAFPVHVVEVKGSELNEVFVGVNDNNELIEVEAPCEDRDILDWLEKYGPPLADGQRIEVPLAMNNWMKEVNVFLEKGFLLTIDYGYSKEELMMPERKDGSLRGYYKHQLINNPLLHPTEMDITSHIHLDAYRDIASDQKLQGIADERQFRFLLQIGMLKFLQENYDPNPFSEKSKQNRAVRTLISDTGMSAAFHVFLHGKNITSVGGYNFLNEDPYLMI